MDKDKVARISVTLGNVAGVMAEFVRQGLPSHGGKTNDEFFQSALLREGEKLRLEGQAKLADGLLSLRAEIGEMDNE